jgi:BlaI family transcriptional regulator, penicillinase repressor
MSQAPPRLGRLELQIMQILWRCGRATVRQVTEELSPTRPLAQNTIQTMLRKLEAKGAVTHDVEDRAFVYRPLCQQSEVTESATRDLLTRLFDGSVYGLVSHLLKHETVSSEELTRLRTLLEEENLR